MVTVVMELNWDDTPARAPGNFSGEKVSGLQQILRGGGRDVGTQLQASILQLNEGYIREFLFPSSPRRSPGLVLICQDQLSGPHGDLEEALGTLMLRFTNEGKTWPTSSGANRRGGRSSPGTGGYETFYSEYPDCCVDVEPISQEKIETERALISQCGKPVLSISYRPAHDQGGPVEILPFLYLGSAYHASKCEFLANLHITALLNVSRRTSEACMSHLHYKWIPVEDSHTADISSHFQEAIDFIDCVREKGGKILVHCEAGISRSPTICMAYLMKTRQFRLKDAFDYIKQRRSVVSPNFGFMGQLLQYESEILPSTPTPQVPSCQGEAASSSFRAHLQTLSPDVQGSYYTFPTSVLAPVPTHSTVSELSRSAMATATSC
ncbi:PREDICTED: dual specificity protein phosphatase 5 [Myotis davidii]|uniref:dual specificity protein phosphatase 5 n=1 Tax=Myotis davidii TaxID=225400 RepID=UPI000767095B|nr:PREDICTED: dual specificity protein phosphatase 5 [Myotis davidii]